MDKLLDILGAIVLWSFIILIMIRVNAQLNDNAFENLNASIAQSNAIAVGEILEFDFQKVGQLITGDKIITADSNVIKYYFDFNSDGTKDSMKYYLGNISELPTTPNPKDKPIYRRFNTTTIAIGNISMLRFKYFDSKGKILDYSSLSTQTNRNKIKTIMIYFLKEGIYANYDNFYPAVEWQRKISPHNL